MGLKKEDVDSIWQELGIGRGQKPPSCACTMFRPVRGNRRFCKFGVQDSLGLGTEIEAFFHRNGSSRESPKSVFQDVPFAAARVLYATLVSLAKKKRLDLYRRRQLGPGVPRIGDVLTENLSKEEVIDLTRRTLEYYRDKIQKKRQRMARFIDRIGNREFQRTPFLDR